MTKEFFEFVIKVNSISDIYSIKNTYIKLLYQKNKSELLMQLRYFIF